MQGMHACRRHQCEMTHEHIYVYIIEMYTYCLHMITVYVIEINMYTCMNVCCILYIIALRIEYVCVKLWKCFIWVLLVILFQEK